MIPTYIQSMIMKRCGVIILASLALLNCTPKGVRQNDVDSTSVDTLQQSDLPVDSIPLPEDFVSEDSIPHQYVSVIDTLNSRNDFRVHSWYFLHDVTGDGIPELWIKYGSCEADMKLWVYSVGKKDVRKIYSGYGGHISFFLNGETVGSVEGHMGTGRVSIYNYRRGKIRVKNVEFSTWNDEGEMIPVKKKGKQIIDICKNSDTYVSFKPLK